MSGKPPADHPISMPLGVLDMYRDAFRTFGRDERALLWGKNKQTVRFSTLCKTIPNAPKTLLDYGCGLGDLADWLGQHRPAISYTGIDALPEFVTSNKAALPGYTFLTASNPSAIHGVFDYIVCSGVFNLDAQNDPQKHWQYVQRTLTALFAKSRSSLHVDFLADDVDFRKPHAYHQSLEDLLNFVGRTLSKRYLLDRSYMPFEFSISIFADDDVDASRNIYNPLIAGN